MCEKTVCMTGPMRHRGSAALLGAMLACCVPCALSRLLVNDSLGSSADRCPEPTSHSNCTKTFLVSTTCIEGAKVCGDHLSQTVVPCPASRVGGCTRFDVEWCNNTVMPAKGGCYRSEYAHTRMMSYNTDFWFGFSLLLPTNYNVGVGSIHFQVHGNPNPGEEHRNPMLELGTDPKTGGWGMQIRGDPRRNITEPNRTYEWYHKVDVGETRLGEWEHFVYHTRWAYDSPTGFAELWRNGNKVVDLLNTGTAYNDGTPPYFKFGIYSASWSFLPAAPPANQSVNTVIYGGFRQGDASSNYSEVDTSKW